MQHMEWEVAVTYADRVLGDTAFWERASERPALTSQPLPDWHMEVMRVHSFLMQTQFVSADVFYRMWQVMDAPFSLSPSFALPPGAAEGGVSSS